MGIFKLVDYARRFGMDQQEIKPIFKQKIFHFDITSYLLSYHHLFLFKNYVGYVQEIQDSIIEDKSDNITKRNELAAKLLEYVVDEINKLIGPYKKEGNQVFLYFDYKIPSDLEFDMKFKEYFESLKISMDTFHDFVSWKHHLSESESEIVKNQSVAIIPKSQLIKSSEINEGSIRCIFESEFLYKEMTNNMEYEVIKDNTSIDEGIKKKLLNIGWSRYLLTKGAKRLALRHMSQDRLSVFKCDIKDHLQTMINNDAFTFASFYQYIPYSFVTFSLPYITNEIIQGSKRERRSEFFNKSPVVCYGCEYESDLVIKKMVKENNGIKEQIIFTSDSDMLVYLCDCECTIHLKKNHIRKVPSIFSPNEKILKMKSQAEISFRKLKSSVIKIQPKRFWKSIFKGVEMDPKIIVTLSVLIGSDFNPPHDKSPIHISSFESILSILNLKSFSELKYDHLVDYIKDKITNHSSYYSVPETVLAINQYLSRYESQKHIFDKGYYPNTSRVQSTSDMHQYLDEYQAYILASH